MQALNANQTINASVNWYGHDYDLYVLPDDDPALPCPALIAIPKNSRNADTLMFDTGNMESTDMRDRIGQAGAWLNTDASITQDDPCTICVPVLPSNGVNTRPYYQQISQDAVENGILDKCKDIMNKTKDLMKEQGLEPDDKVILAGYSSSGSAAQRLALGLSTADNKDNIPAAVIAGGASSDIPVPSEDFDWPIGIRNFKEVTGHDFDMNVYKNIRQYCYIDSGEYDHPCTDDDLRHDDAGNIAPMADMTYMDRSVDAKTGRAYRLKYGSEQFERISNVVEDLQNNYDMNIRSDIIDTDRKGHYGFLADPEKLSIVRNEYLNTLEYCNDHDFSRTVPTPEKSLPKTIERFKNIGNTPEKDSQQPEYEAEISTF